MRRAFASAAPPRPAFALAVDLGSGIGSATWWRGLVTCLLLVAGSLTLSPLTRAAPASATVTAPPVATATVTPLPASDGMTVAATSVANESLIAALVRSGAGIDEAGAVARLLAPYGDMARLEAGTRLTLSLGGRPAAYAPRRLHALTVSGAGIDARVTRVGSTFAVTSKRAPTTAPLHLSGRAGDGIFVSANAAGICPKRSRLTFARSIRGSISARLTPPHAFPSSSRANAAPAPAFALGACSMPGSTAKSKAHE